MPLVLKTECFPQSSVFHPWCPRNMALGDHSQMFSILRRQEREDWHRDPPTHSGGSPDRGLLGLCKFAQGISIQGPGSCCIVTPTPLLQSLFSDSPPPRVFTQLMVPAVCISGHEVCVSSAYVEDLISRPPHRSQDLWDIHLPYRPFVPTGPGFSRKPPSFAGHHPSGNISQLCSILCCPSRKCHRRLRAAITPQWHMMPEGLIALVKHWVPWSPAQ